MTPLTMSHRALRIHLLIRSRAVRKVCSAGHRGAHRMSSRVFMAEVASSNQPLGSNAQRRSIRRNHCCRRSCVASSRRRRSGSRWDSLSRPNIGWCCSVPLHCSSCLHRIRSQRCIQVDTEVRCRSCRSLDLERKCDRLRSPRRLSTRCWGRSPCTCRKAGCCQESNTGLRACHS